MATPQIGNEKLRVGGVELEVYRSGRGPVMLLLHGGGGLDHRARFLELLAAHFDVIAPSHPGFGRSELPDHFDSVDDLAFLYLDLVEQYELSDVTLMGFSLGGWIAAELAVRCSHRLKRLILVGAVGIKISDRETRDIPDIFALAPDEVTRLAFHDPSRATVDFTALSDEELHIIARNREALALYTWEPYMHNPRLRHHLGRIRVPTLFLRGASDGLVSQHYAQAYASLIPGARLEVIGEAGHAPQIEKPSEFVERVVAFVS